MRFISNLFNKKKVPAVKKTARRTVGDIGEQIACEHLISLGYEIIARNAQISHKEIDIVAENDEYTVIAEVKTLSKTKREAEESKNRASDKIDREKAENVLSAAKAWCAHNYTGRTPRIDVIEVYLGDTPPSVVHMENAINKQTLYRKRR